VAVRVQRIAGNRTLGMVDKAGQVGVAIDSPVVLKHPVVRVSEVRVGKTRFRIELNGAGEQCDRLLAVRPRGPAEMPDTAEGVIPGREICRGLTHRPLRHLLEELGSQRHRDRLRDLVAAGNALIAPAITKRLIAEFARLRPRQVKPDALSALTPREIEILGLVAEGLSNREIADRLVLSDETVKTHVSHVLRKLDLRDRAQAVVVAYECGLVVPRA
jgi:DNA-binding CsgD family transcriptional regulator